MSETKHNHRFNNSIDIETLDSRISIHNVLQKNGIHQDIDIQSYGEQIRIAGVVHPDGRWETKVFQNDKLIKQIVNGQVIPKSGENGKKMITQILI